VKQIVKAETLLYQMLYHVNFLNVKYIEIT